MANGKGPVKRREEERAGEKGRKMKENGGENPYPKKISQS